MPFRLEVSYGEDKVLSDYTVSVTFNVSAGGLFGETKNPLPLAACRTIWAEAKI